MGHLRNFTQNSKVRLQRRIEVLEFFQKVFKACGRFEQLGDSFLYFWILDALNDEVSFHPIFAFGLASEHQVSSIFFCILLNVAPIEWWNFMFSALVLSSLLSFDHSYLFTPPHTSVSVAKADDYLVTKGLLVGGERLEAGMRRTPLDVLEIFSFIRSMR